MLESLVGRMIVSALAIENIHGEVFNVQLRLDDGQVVDMLAKMTYDFTPDDDGRGEIEIKIAK